MNKLYCATPLFLLPVKMNVFAQDGGRIREDWMMREGARREECVFTLVSSSSWGSEMSRDEVGELRVREYAVRCYG
jgi:hypothetical protein